MNSKIIGSESKFFAGLAVDAIYGVKTTNSDGLSKYPIKSINVLSAHGKSTKESTLVNGYALRTLRAS